MRYLVFIVLFQIWQWANGQNNGILIQTNRSDTLFTNYVMFSRGYTSNDRYIQIHDKKGPKYNISQIHHVEGYDQKGDYRYILPLRLSGSAQFWGERLEKSTRTGIYYADFSSLSWSQNLRLRPSDMYYTFDNASLKKLRYGNVKADVSKFPNAQSHLRAGKTLQITQIVMYTVGAGMIVYGIAKTFEPLPPDPDGSPAIGGPNLHPTVFVGAALVNIPFFMASAKQKHLRKALMAVE